MEEKKIDAAVIGRSFINNPDLVSRLFNGQPLNETLGFPLNPHTFYNFVESPSEGYVSAEEFFLAAGTDMRFNSLIILISRPRRPKPRHECCGWY